MAFVYSNAIVADIKTELASILTATGLFTTVTTDEPLAISDTQLPLVLVDSGDATYSYAPQEKITVREFYIILYHTRLDDIRVSATDRNTCDALIEQITLTLLDNERLNSQRFVDSVTIMGDSGSGYGSLGKTTRYTGTMITIQVQYTFRYKD